MLRRWKHTQEYAPGSSKPAKRKEAKRGKGQVKSPAATRAKPVTMSTPDEAKAAFPTLEEHLCWPTTDDAESGG